MTLCTECGTENRANARFCLGCGARLTPEQPAASAQAAPEEPETSPAASDNPEPPVEEEAPPAEAPLDETPPEAIADEPPDEASLDEEPIPAASDPQPPQPETVEPEEDEEETAIEPPVEEPEEAEDVGEPLETVETDGDKEPLVDAGEMAGDEPEPEMSSLLPPLDNGICLEDRYEIISLLEETPETLLYEAYDYGRCSYCGYAESQAGDAFCANCGASLGGENAPRVHLRSLRVAGEAVIQLEEETNGRVEFWFEEDGRLYAVLPYPNSAGAQSSAGLHWEPVDTQSDPFSRGVRHIVGYNSDAGLERELDEDAMLALTFAPMFESVSQPSLGLYVVTDGMGGHDSGEVASRLAIEGLADTITRRLFLPELTGEPVLPESPRALLQEAIEAINTKIYHLQLTTGTDMGTTLTAALVRGDLALIANVGDSRTYLWRDGELSQITADHSLVAELVAAGAITPEEVYTHPDKSAIFRSLGHNPDVEVDIFTQPLQPGDQLLLCCDGVWEMLRTEGIEEVLLLEPDPQRACDEIVRRSNLAGGEDNISVIIVQFEGLNADLLGYQE